MNSEFLNKYRITRGPMASDPSIGFNGAFLIPLSYTNSRGFNEMEVIKVVASDGFGWQHVSVSLNDRPTVCPKWEIMCEVKALFWDPEEAVMQLHPPQSTWVNNHTGCLHLWRPLESAIPLPPSLLVGVPGGPLTEEKAKAVQRTLPRMILYHDAEPTGMGGKTTIV